MFQSELLHDLRLAQNGDRLALERLLAALRPRLEQLARGYPEPGGSRESTADLAQEGAVRIWQKLDQFQGGEDDAQTLAMFHDWVARIVRHLAVDGQRERHAQRREPPGGLRHLPTAEAGESSSGGGGIDPAASGPTPSANLQADEQARLIRAALERIPDATDREMVRLCFFEGLSLRQIAERLNLTYDKVRERYHHSLRLLERELGGLL